MFCEWQTARGQASNEGDCLQDISTPVENFDAGSLVYWLGKFVQEVVNKDGQSYPGRTLYSSGMQNLILFLLIYSYNIIRRF